MDTQRHVITSAVLGGGVLVLLLAAGCSGTPGTPATEYAQVTGHVRYNGKPIVQGKITVVTDTGAFDSAPIADGQYVLSRAPVGTVHVTLVGRTDRPNPKEDPKGALIKRAAEQRKAWEAQGKNPEDLPPDPPPKDPKAIPSKYNGDRTTPLTREVKPGSQVIDFDIPDEVHGSAEDQQKNRKTPTRGAGD
jgi:hypothetical protein